VQAALERMIREFDPRVLDETKAKEVKSKLAELAGWLDEGKRENLYWTDLSQAIKDLLDNVPPDPDPPDGQGVLKDLVKNLQQAEPPDLKAKMERHGDYARLKILWERRNTADFPELVGFQLKNPPLEDLFSRADDLAWQRLKKACEDKARIIAPLGPQPAFWNLLFEFTTDQASLDCTYLVMHGLQYEWTFTRTFRRFFFFKREVPCAVRSVSPKVVQYAQGRGEA
jgi:hypothetical protein